MSEILDARGLSCPQPVLDTLAKIESMGSGTFEVQVDTEAAKENISRAVQGKGWRVESVVEEGGEYRLVLAGG